jgi:hypothetical protein
VVYKTPEVGRQNSHSFLEWRVKRDVEGDAYFIGLRMIPDTYVGPPGSLIAILRVAQAPNSVRGLLLFERLAAVSALPQGRKKQMQK